VAPPAVEEEAEEEGHDEARVKAVRVRVEHPVSLEGPRRPPEPAVGRQVSGLGDQS
jgi:hypothetical protein